MGILFSADGLYARIMERFWELLVISLLWIVCSIPLVTAGAASAAAYHTAAKVVRHGADKPIPAFFSSFKTNLRQSIPLTIGAGILLLMLGAECLALYSNPEAGTGMIILLCFALLSVLGALAYLWPCLSRFNRSSLSFLQMAVTLTFRHFPVTVLVLLLRATMLGAVWLMPWGIMIFPGAALWIETYLMERILLRYSPIPEENSPEAQMWYYQK